MEWTKHPSAKNDRPGTGRSALMPAARTFAREFFIMRNTLRLLFGLLLLASNPAHSQSSASTLDVISWNLEFFGAPFNSGPLDKDLQEANAKKLMRYFDADIYGLVEIVDTSHLRKL